MTTMSEIAVAALIDLYPLSAPPGPSEIAVLEAQMARVAALLATRPVAAGALFAIDPQAFPDVLARLSDEPET